MPAVRPICMPCCTGMPSVEARNGVTKPCSAAACAAQSEAFNSIKSGHRLNGLELRSDAHSCGPKQTLPWTKVLGAIITWKQLEHA